MCQTLDNTKKKSLFNIGLQNITNYFYTIFHVRTVHFDKLIFIVTLTTAHIVSIKLYYNCSICFSATTFTELKVCFS
jgi:hypothetical protein